MRNGWRRGDVDGGELHICHLYYDVEISFTPYTHYTTVLIHPLLLAAINCELGSSHHLGIRQWGVHKSLIAYSYVNTPIYTHIS